MKNKTSPFRLFNLLAINKFFVLTFSSPFFLVPVCSFEESCQKEDCSSPLSLISSALHPSLKRCHCECVELLQVTYAIRKCFETYPAKRGDKKEMMKRRDEERKGRNRRRMGIEGREEGGKSLKDFSLSEHRPRGISPHFSSRLFPNLLSIPEPSIISGPPFPYSF